MADGDIDINFKTPGLAKANRDLEKTNKTVDKIEKSEKKLGTTAKKVNRQIIKDEKEKIKLLEKQKKIKDADARRREALRVRQERTDRRTQAGSRLFSGAAKVGGAGGTALGGIGEGVAIGGALGALAGGAAVLGVAFQALTVNSDRAAAAAVQVLDFRNALRDTTQSIRDQNQSRGASLLTGDRSSILQLNAFFGDLSNSIIKLKSEIDDPALLGTFAGATGKRGVIESVGLNKLIELVKEGNQLGQGSAAIFSRLAAINPTVLKQQAKQGTVAQTAFGLTGDTLNNVRANRGSAFSPLARRAQESVAVGGQQAGLDVQAAVSGGTVQQRLQLARSRSAEGVAGLRVANSQLAELEKLTAAAEVQNVLLKNIKETFSVLGVESADQTREQFVANINQAQN